MSRPHPPQVRPQHPARKPPLRHLGIPGSLRGLSILVSAIGAVATGALHAQTANVGVVANDSAANDTLPSNPPGSTSTGGFGFGNWTSFGFTGAGNNGAFNGVSNNNGFTGGTNIGNTNAWGMYDSSGAVVGAFRSMTTGLQVGQSLSFDYDNGFIDTGKRQEVVLFSNGTGGRIEFPSVLPAVGLIPSLTILRTVFEEERNYGIFLNYGMNWRCLGFRHLVKFRNSVRLSDSVSLISEDGIIPSLMRSPVRLSTPLGRDSPRAACM